MVDRPDVRLEAGSWKCEGLDPAGLLGKDPGAPWNTVDRDAEPGWEWRSAASDSPEELYALWESAVAQSRANIREFLAGGGVDRPVAYVSRRGESPSLRRILVDLIEEYARHVGQADLIRESVDGRVGEGPPADF